MEFQKLLKHKFVYLFVLLIFAAWYARASHLSQPEQQGTAPGFTQPFEVVHVFMEAVKRGELIVFDYVLTADMIIPEQVDYTYRLDAPDSPDINIYSRLVKPMQFREAEGLEIQGVSATLDTGGHIIETRAHVQSQ